MTSTNSTGEITNISSRSMMQHVGLEALRLASSSYAIDAISSCFGGNISSILPVNLLIFINILLLATILFISYQVWTILFSPIDVFYDVGSIGFVHHDKRISKHKTVNITRRQRLVGETPPVYPNGWFRLIDSNMLKKGQLKSMFALGEHLAVFRNKKGVVRVLDAHCPHMGANMATGGRVFGSDCLQCPFHGWTFSGETGKLVDIPYTTKVPNFVSVRKWPVCEINNIIYVWYDCDGKEPSWKLTKLSNLQRLKYVGRTEHIVNSHVQEIPENAADVAHLQHLHKPIIGRDVENTYGPVWNFLRHDIEAAWRTPDDPEYQHISTMEISDATHFKLFGIRIPLKKMFFHIEQIGPGNVHIHINTPYFRGVLIQTITPTEPLLQRLSHTFYVEPLVPMFIAKSFLYLEATQIERDIMVWNNKKYLLKPLLVKEESSIVKHRRWFRQFYSENSPRLNSAGTALINPLRTEVNDW
ncbi:cholesterol 7-desaturase nvd 2-like [Styela clava]